MKKGLCTTKRMETDRKHGRKGQGSEEGWW
jgi:hypothetical protein